jgi:hypothetical protein
LTLALLLGAALGGVPAAQGAVSFQRTDIPITGPESVALGDLDGKNGKDIVVALSSTGSVGVMLNQGNGTFGAMKTYSAGPGCAGLAVDITLGYLTPLPSDGRLDAYVACRPNVGGCAATARARWPTRRRSTSGSRSTTTRRATCSR